MPVLSTTYYSNYTPSSGLSSRSHASSAMLSTISRPYSSSHTSTLSSYKSRSSYDLTTPLYRPSSYSSHNSYLSSNTYKIPSSYSSNTSNYYTNRLSSNISGISSSPSSVTLTSYNQRRASLDYNDENISPLKSNIPVAGLTNLGNTCYMNSVLQALYATRALREFITDGSESGGSLYYALARLFKEMTNSRKSGFVNPSAFRSLFIQYQPKFRGYEQHDAQEFLRYLINGIHDEVNKAKKRPKTRLIEPKSSQEAWNQYKSVIDDSRLIDLFVGQFASVIKCTDCGNESSCWDPFWDLSLPLPRERNSRGDIEKCLQEFTAQEVLDDDEQPLCSRCKRHRRSTKRLTVQRSPPILILHIKKFSNDGYKTPSDINVNQTLSIDSKTYYLYACVCHHGYSSRSGHYTAYCQYDSKWYHFNDERVKDVSDSFSTSLLNDAYVLFYHQRNDSYNYTSRL